MAGRVPGTFLNKPPAPRRHTGPEARRFEAACKANGARVAEVWSVGEVGVLCSLEPTPAGEFRWHVSLSAEGRYPTWDEMKTAAYAIPTIALEPGRTFAQLFGDPALDTWVDVHPTTLHLYEIDNPRVPARAGEGGTAT